MIITYVMVGDDKGISISEERSDALPSGECVCAGERERGGECVCAGEKGRR
jgi:hypothetical protein